MRERDREGEKKRGKIGGREESERNDERVLLNFEIGNSIW